MPGHAPNAGGLGSIPGQGTRSHMLQLKILHSATKTGCSQINTLKKKNQSLSLTGHISSTQQPHMAGDHHIGCCRQRTCPSFQKVLSDGPIEKIMSGDTDPFPPHPLPVCRAEYRHSMHTWLFFSFWSKILCSIFRSFLVSGFFSFLDRGGALVFFFFFPGRTRALLASTPFNVSLSEKICSPDPQPWRLDSEDA